MNTPTFPRHAVRCLFRRVSFVAALGGLSFGLTSCDIFLTKPEYVSYNPKVVVPADFLVSDYSDYNEWMDTGVRIAFHNVPLNEVFRNEPFTDLAYLAYDTPEKMPLVTIDATGITRRQLLWAIAHDYNIKMTLRTLSNGQPSAIVARAREVPQPTMGRYD